MAGAAISAVLASCGSDGGEPATQFGAPVAHLIGATLILGSLASGDFDRDGRVDIIVRSAEGPLFLLRGNGDGTFKPQETIPGIQVATGVAAGDLNRDGNLDLVVTGCPSAPCPPEAIALFTMAGKGDGAFDTPIAHPTPYPVARGFASRVADFNGDGWPDAAVMWSRPKAGIFSEWNELGIFLGSATGITPAPDLTVSLGPLRPGHVAGVSAPDVDADGKPDLLVYVSAIDGGGGNAGMSLGRGDGTFDRIWGVNAPCVLGSRYALADFNQDGKPDLVIGMGDLCKAPTNLFLGNGGGTFADATPVGLQAPSDVSANDAQQSSSAVLAGDLNGDGYPDLLVRWTGSSALSLLYGRGDGTFNVAVEYGLDVSGRIERLLDLNGDGRPDLVLIDTNAVVTMLNTR